MILSGTGDNPSVVPNVRERVKAYKGGNEAESQALEERLHLWHAFRNSREGQIAHELTEPHIALREDILKSNIRDLRMSHGGNLTEGELREYLAEVRGELRIWTMIRDGELSLQQRLEELQAEKEKPKKDLTGEEAHS